jgi:hypothetical protein
MQSGELKEWNSDRFAHPIALNRDPEQLPGQVTIVAQVISIHSQSTNCVYWLDDGSGRIEARHWLDASSPEDAEKWAGVTYVGFFFQALLRTDER